MKRMIVASKSDVCIWDKSKYNYPVTEITECSFPGMVAFNVTDTEDKAALLRNSSMVQELVIPKERVLLLKEATADNILECMSSKFPDEDEITADDVALILREHDYSGLLTKDGTLCMIAGRFTRKKA